MDSINWIHFFRIKHCTKLSSRSDLGTSLALSLSCTFCTILYSRDTQPMSTLQRNINVFNLFFCRKCTCANGEEKLVTSLGCKNGGIPRCRVNGQVTNDGPFGAMDPLSCTNPNKKLAEWDFISARTDSTPRYGTLNTGTLTIST